MTKINTEKLEEKILQTFQRSFSGQYERFSVIYPLDKLEGDDVHLPVKMDMYVVPTNTRHSACKEKLEIEVFEDASLLIKVTLHCKNKVVRLSGKLED